MAQFCGNCGNPLAENQRFCPNCGASASGAPSNGMNNMGGNINTVVMVKPKIPGRGLGIAGMVLGIIGLVYSFSFCLISSTFVDAVERARDQFQIDEAMLDLEGIIPGIMMFVVMNILALCFGVSASNKGYRNGVQKSGVIMGIVGIALNIITFIIVGPHL